MFKEKHVADKADTVKLTTVLTLNRIGTCIFNFHRKTTTVWTLHRIGTSLFNCHMKMITALT